MENKKREDIEKDKTIGREMIFSGGAIVPDSEKEDVCFEYSVPRPKEKIERHLGLVFLALTSVLLFAFIFIVCLSVGGDKPVSDESDLEVGVNEDNTDTEEPVFKENNEEELSTSGIYEKCKDSVVSISARSGKTSGIGSGFIYDENGYIATANHVIENMEEIYVIFADGSKEAAQVIAENSFTDIALLKVDRRGLKCAELGDPGKLLVGERVVAIGTPASLDYAGSVSAGEVSYLDRIVKIYDSESGVLQKKMKLIQTTAPLNPGNSGCPLFDMEGKVVGMVTMRLGSDFSGIGFALPSKAVFDILSAMKLGREIDGALLSAICSESANLGVLVEESKEKSGCFKICGFSSDDCDAALKLKAGDIILAVDDVKIESGSDISKALEVYSPDDKITVTVLRGGQQLSFEVSLTN